MHILWLPEAVMRPMPKGSDDLDSETPKVEVRRRLENEPDSGI
jgi:hypothetical protein